MKLLVIGSPADVVTQLRSMAAAMGGRPSIAVVDGGPSPDPTRCARPDWIILTAASDRPAAVERFGLAPHRVLTLPALAAASTLEERSDLLRATLRRMAAIGPPRALVSALGVSLAKIVIRTMQARVEQRGLADDQRLIEEKAARRAAKVGARRAAEPVRETPPVKSASSSTPPAGDADQRTAAKAAQRAAKKEARRRLPEPAATSEPASSPEPDPALVPPPVPTAPTKDDLRALRKAERRAAKVERSPSGVRPTATQSSIAHDESDLGADLPRETENARRFAARARRWATPSA